MAVHKECLEKAKDMSGMCVKPMTPGLKYICYTQKFFSIVFWFPMDCRHRIWTRTGLTVHCDFVLVSFLLLFCGYVWLD